MFNRYTLLDVTTDWNTSNIISVLLVCSRDGVVVFIVLFFDNLIAISLLVSSYIVQLVACLLLSFWAELFNSMQGNVTMLYFLINLVSFVRFHIYQTVSYFAHLFFFSDIHSKILSLFPEVIHQKFCKDRCVNRILVPKNVFYVTLIL